ncbi:hypothetical protein SMICM17S_06969 [Streptomyces microflavus]
MGAHGDHAALVDEDDPVGDVQQQRRGGERDRRTAPAQPRDPGGDARLVPVDGGGRLVQHQRLRVGDERPGQREALALTAGERPAPLGDPGPHRVPVGVGGGLGQCGEHIAALRGLQRRLGGDQARGRHVQQLLERAGEQHRVLVLDRDHGTARCPAGVRPARRHRAGRTVPASPARCRCPGRRCSAMAAQPFGQPSAPPRPGRRMYVGGELPLGGRSARWRGRRGRPTARRAPWPSGRCGAADSTQYGALRGGPRDGIRPWRSPRSRRLGTAPG